MCMSVLGLSWRREGCSLLTPRVQGWLFRVISAFVTYKVTYQTLICTFCVSKNLRTAAAFADPPDPVRDPRASAAAPDRPPLPQHRLPQHLPPHLQGGWGADTMRTLNQEGTNRLKKGLKVEKSETSPS